MTKTLQLIACLLSSIVINGFVWANGSVSANAQAEPLPLMPYPQQVEQQPGQFIIGDSLGYFSNSNNNVVIKKQMQALSQRIKKQTGQSIRLKQTSAAKAQLVIHVSDATSISNKINEWDEAYQLRISTEKIELSAPQWIGIERGLETLLQLIGTDPQITLPLVAINDYPRFKWRGLLLDTSRHFFSIATIKRQIDAMAAAKYNIFHWHLTDDQGWRLESKRYPKLHKLASDGEYYTRKQIREVVAYARERGIQVLPEIDMPGHASAIAVAYPELMSAPGPYAMEYRWGVHKPTLNPANEDVYKFAEAIIAELTELFPFEYIHIGGDEVDPEQWNQNAAIQTFMQTQGLKDHRALQAYFNQRLQKILAKHNRKMIGWDEIQHPNLSKDIVIHSWRGPDGVSDAVSHGFQAILSTGYYLDQPQYAGYHYRNDPIPPKPVVLADTGSNLQINSWRFEMPRKRGNPVTGTFTFIGDEKNITQAFIDFTGKSRRNLLLTDYTKNNAQFSVDTWMGPVEFQVIFSADKMHGRALVGNTPYNISGDKISSNISLQNVQKTAKNSSQQHAQKQLPKTEPVAHLSAQQEALVLGGEAALWAEIVDEQSIDLRLWPRAFIVAERLWSARDLQDENSMYRRANSVERWAEKSVDLLHRHQHRVALQKLAGKYDVKPLQFFAEQLEPAHYYHRQHEKSTYETYSKADQLNRLADALPAENESLRQFNLRLDAWLKDPQINADYAALRSGFERWVVNRAALQSVLDLHPELIGLADRTELVARTSLQLLDKRINATTLAQSERKKIMELISRSQKMDQEIVLATATSLEKIMNSFTPP
ncbi:MAG TPA: family 20 glycosylhydrolase [Cellvibrio sp.]|nr:family 20 glycosylhydrolase [Cellvibrio sp.]